MAECFSTRLRYAFQGFVFGREPARPLNDLRGGPGKPLHGAFTLELVARSRLRYRAYRGCYLPYNCAKAGPARSTLNHRGAAYALSLGLGLKP